MSRKLLKTDGVEVDARLYQIRYFEMLTVRGARRYSAEIALGPDDQVILDDDSMLNLETRATKVMPATLFSRGLLKTA